VPVPAAASRVNALRAAGVPTVEVIAARLACDGAAAGPRMSCGERLIVETSCRRFDGLATPGYRGNYRAIPAVVE